MRRVEKFGSNQLADPTLSLQEFTDVVNTTRGGLCCGRCILKLTTAGVFVVESLKSTYFRINLLSRVSWVVEGEGVEFCNSNFFSFRHHVSAFAHYPSVLDSSGLQLERRMRSNIYRHRLILGTH